MINSKDILDFKNKKEKEPVDESDLVNQTNLITAKEISELQYKTVVRDGKRIKKPFTDNPNHKVVNQGGRVKEVPLTAKEKRNRSVAREQSKAKFDAKQDISQRKRQRSIKKKGTEEK